MDIKIALCPKCKTFRWISTADLQDDLHSCESCHYQFYGGLELLEDKNGNN